MSPSSAVSSTASWRVSPPGCSPEPRGGGSSLTVGRRGASSLEVDTSSADSVKAAAVWRRGKSNFSCSLSISAARRRMCASKSLVAPPFSLGGQSMCERLPPGEVHAYRIFSMAPSVPCCATVGSSHAHPCGNSPRDSIRDLIVSVSTRPGIVNCRSSLRAVLTLDSTAFQPALRLCPNAERMMVFERPMLELITSAAAVKRSRCDHALVPKLFPFGCVSCIKAAHTLSTWTLLAVALCGAVT
eukprot:scaffold12817_cov75-Phaeocystis_antarctica.AAC.9